MDIAKDRIRYLGVNFALADIRHFVAACIEEAERSLDNKFFLDGALSHSRQPQVPNVQLLHKESFEGNGYGLIHKSVQDRLVGYAKLRSCVESGPWRVDVLIRSSFRACMSWR